MKFKNSQKGTGKKEINKTELKVLNKKPKGPDIGLMF